MQRNWLKVQNRFFSIDKWLLASSLTLVVLGLVVLTSVSIPLSLERFGRPYAFLAHQIVYGLMPGIVLGFAFFKIPLEKLRKLALPLLLLNILLLILVFVPQFSVSAGGAARWINIGPLSFQPSEFLKITFLIYLSAWLSKNVGERLKKPARTIESLAGFLLILGVITILLILQPDIGTWAIIALVAAVSYFLAGVSFLHIFLLLGIGAASLFYLVNTASYRLNRFLVFLKPDIDPMGIGYQIKQALIAIGSGGIGGLGLGMGIQKFGLLPQPMTDAIFAVLAEESGFIGGTLLVIMFLIFLWRGFVIANGSQNSFARLLAFSIAVWIVSQAFINIGAMVGLLPLTGIPLPFVSYGGSAIIAELIGVGILLNISKNA